MQLGIIWPVDRRSTEVITERELEWRKSAAEGMQRFLQINNVEQGRCVGCAASFTHLFQAGIDELDLFCQMMHRHGGRADGHFIDEFAGLQAARAGQKVEASSYPLDYFRSTLDLLFAHWSSAWFTMMCEQKGDDLVAHTVGVIPVQFGSRTTFAVFDTARFRRSYFHLFDTSNDLFGLLQNYHRLTQFNIHLNRFRERS